MDSLHIIPIGDDEAGRALCGGCGPFYSMVDVKVVVLNPDILTVKQAAVYLKLNVQALYQLANEGKIPAIRVGGQWCFSRAALENYVRGRV